MPISNLKCPHCQTSYSLGRLLGHKFGGRFCHGCKSRLAFTPESSRRVGAWCGLVNFALLFPLAVTFGTTLFYSWPFWIGLVVFAPVAGGVLASRVAVFAPHEQVRAQRRRIELFPNLSRRDRWILVVHYSLIIPLFALVLLRLMPEWLLLPWALTACVVSIFALPILWRKYFGKHGMLRGAGFGNPSH
ncbi:MAG: hypothetical protein K8R92_09105 [Planctomycetes bacterium]|nr:hypothetical protein [Planctomycetota bacterium]